ncbi:MAG: hypothetical protein V8R87_02150 [Faecalibacterium prausnitzii]
MHRWAFSNCRSDGNGGNWVELNDKRYYMVLEPLQVYNRGRWTALPRPLPS